MRIEEVQAILSRLKWWLNDNGEQAAAIKYEDAECKLCEIPAYMCREYADMLVPRRMLRAHIALHSRVHARAMILLLWLLRNVS